MPAHAQTKTGAKWRKKPATHLVWIEGGQVATRVLMAYGEADVTAISGHEVMSDDSFRSAIDMYRVSSDLQRRCLTHVWHPCTQMQRAWQLPESLSQLTGGVLGHCFTASEGASAVEIAVLNRFEQDRVLEANREQAAILTAALAPLAADPRIAHFRQQGMIWAFDVREPFAGPRFAERVHLAGRTRELLTRPIGRTVYLLPPYVLPPSCRPGWRSSCAPRWTKSFPRTPPMLIAHLNRQLLEREAAASMDGT